MSLATDIVNRLKDNPGPEEAQALLIAWVRRMADELPSPIMRLQSEDIANKYEAWQSRRAQGN